jgi:hypothetical protein
MSCRKLTLEELVAKGVFLGSSDESVDNDSVDARAERLHRQFRWLDAKRTLEPGKWDGWFRDEGTGSLIPPDTWTPAMRQKFGQFKVG